MGNQSFRRMRDRDVLRLGGFKCVRPGPWRRYLQAALVQKYPIYAVRSLFGLGGQQNPVGFEENGSPAPWKDNNCVLTALDQYLFARFGAVVPRDNLFRVYNPRGEGILPQDMLEAIAAVIEPLGYEIERVMVPDPELRNGLGRAGLTAGMEAAGLFDGQPGVGMINLSNGYSHAFFWKEMEALKFTQPQFRLAVLVRPVGGEPEPQQASITGALLAYCDLLALRPECQPALALAADLLAEVQAWVRERNAGGAVTPEPCLREEAAHRLEAVQAAAGPAGEDVLLAGQILRRGLAEFEHL